MGHSSILIARGAIIDSIRLFQFGFNVTICSFFFCFTLLQALFSRFGECEKKARECETNSIMMYIVVLHEQTSSTSSQLSWFFNDGLFLCRRFFFVMNSAYRRRRWGGLRRWSVNSIALMQLMNFKHCCWLATVSLLLTSTPLLHFILLVSSRATKGNDRAVSWRKWWSV